MKTLHIRLHKYGKELWIEFLEYAWNKYKISVEIFLSKLDQLTDYVW